MNIYLQFFLPRRRKPTTSLTNYLYKKRMCSRVAVVTGGNKGIGFAIVKALCIKFDGIVYLTARDEVRGKTAVEELQKEGLSPKFHQLDIEDIESIKALREFLHKEHNGLDVLINNAAIAYKIASTVPFEEQAENTVKVNFFGTLNVCRELFPILRPHARVVNVSSSAGKLSNIANKELQSKFLNPSLTENQLCDLMNQFIGDVKLGIHKENGWANSAYQVSKIGLTALSFIQHRKFSKDSRSDIIVNSVHPGYVDTDMTSHKGILKPEQGAEAPVYLALLPPDVDTPRGEFVWNDKKIASWL